MPQWRKLHAKITESFDFNEMPNDFTRLLWVLLPLGLDREGRGVNNTSWIKSKLMPLRDDVSKVEIEEAMRWFFDRGMLVAYEHDKRKYFYAPTFHEHQGNTNREAASNYPEPTQDLLMTSSGLTQEQGEKKSSTDSDSDSDADSDAEEEGEKPDDFFPFKTKTRKTSGSINPALIVLESVVGVVTKTEHLEIVNNLITRHTQDKTQAALQESFDAWCSCKTKSGKPYSPQNYGWVGWAVSLLENNYREWEGKNGNHTERDEPVFTEQELEWGRIARENLEAGQKAYREKNV